MRRCKNCDSVRMKKLMERHDDISKLQCRDCNHVEIGGVLYHDRWCCDMVFRKGGGAAGSTRTSRARWAEALLALEAVETDPPVGE